MSCYVYCVTKFRKKITWKCRDRHEARIVMSNLSRSDLINSIVTIDLAYQVEQNWLKQCNMYDTQQFITYESNKSYYFPWVALNRRVVS